MALGVTLATKLVTGIRCDTTADLIAVVVLLSVLNTILRPLLVLVSLPFILLTLGFGVLVINALLFLFVGKLVSGFHVDGFWPALWGALIVSITNMLLSGFTRPPRPPRGPSGPSGPSGPPVRDAQSRDGVIDI